MNSSFSENSPLFRISLFLSQAPPFFQSHRFLPSTLSLTNSSYPSFHIAKLSCQIMLFLSSQYLSYLFYSVYLLTVSALVHAIKTSDTRFLKWLPNWFPCQVSPDQCMFFTAAKVIFLIHKLKHTIPLFNKL